MTERHRELQRYVRLSAEDSERVAASASFVAPHLTRISDVFYERIREHEDAHAVLQDEAQINRLRGSLVKWMADLFLGPHDDAHFARAERIGHVHVHVGLPARYMVSAMSVVRQELVGVLVRAGRVEHATSVALLLDVELAVMLDAYWEHYAVRTRDLSKAARLAAGQPDVGPRDDMTQAIEQIGVIVVGLDHEGRVALFNDEAERTTGYGADEILGRHVTTLFPREEADAIHARLAAAAQKDASSAFDSVLVTRVGRVREIRARFKRVRTGPRGLTTFLTATDVTEEIALQKRTRQAERLAAIGRLAAGLAHEIRNPLNGAHLHLTILDRALRKQGAREGDEALGSVKTVSAEVQRLSALVTEFLQFARPQPLTLRPTLLGDVCTHSARILGPEAERHGVALELDLPLSPVHVRADRDKLSQVLMNLVRNAIEAIAADAEADAPSGVPVGHVVLRVRRHPREVFVEVEDDGPGIAKSDAPIFDAFYSTKPAGTGLGLPIAHRIVQDHGGVLTFESGQADARAPSRNTFGRKTTFRIKLPVLDAQDHEDGNGTSDERRDSGR
ncbi:MAG: PAS domain S-box protein [Sandaracinaceae bacterium]|nr:PAS domain S-box protein [Sandaracinaceae bacterium]